VDRIEFEDTLRKWGGRRRLTKFPTERVVRDLVLDTFTARLQ
jgi:hypothetical protein